MITIEKNENEVLWNGTSLSKAMNKAEDFINSMREEIVYVRKYSNTKIVQEWVYRNRIKKSSLDKEDFIGA